MADVAQPRRRRSWYKRPLVWLVLAILAALAVFGVREAGGEPVTIRYSDFLNQLDVSNVASVVFSGKEIDGHFKRPVAEAGVANGTRLMAFRTYAPDFGDPALLPELRKERVAISVGSSQWLGTGVAAVLGIIGAFVLAKPMLLVIGAAFIAGLARIARGGKMDIGSILAMIPMFRSVSSRSGEEKDSTGDWHPAGNSSVSTEREIAHTVHHHCTRPWYLRPPVWVLAVVFLGLAAFGIVEFSHRPSATALSYSDFLNQLDAGNVASVTFDGTQLDGKFKRPVAQTATSKTAAESLFRSQVPSISDPALLPELREEHVIINVVSSSSWLSWLGRLPWPLVLFVAFILVAGLVRLIRGRKSTDSSTDTIQQMPMMRLMSGLFGKRAQRTGDKGPAPPKI